MKKQKKTVNNAGDPMRQPGREPERDAWFTAFFIENHLDHFTHPDHAASPEQVRFMVFTEDEQRYYPCSQKMFNAIMSREKPRFLATKYGQVLDRVMMLIDSTIEDETERKYLSSLIRIKWEHEIRDHIMIPSRLEKRLVRIFLNRTQIEDPCANEKFVRNRRMQTALDSEAFSNAMNYIEKDFLDSLPKSLHRVREYADTLELTRLIALSGAQQLWNSDVAKTYTEKDYIELFEKPMLQFEPGGER